MYRDCLTSRRQVAVLCLRDEDKVSTFSYRYSSLVPLLEYDYAASGCIRARNQPERCPGYLSIPVKSTGSAGFLPSLTPDLAKDALTTVAGISFLSIALMCRG
jgi:hypothetical protein